MLNVDRPLVMGILNLTPDSFFDGGALQSPQQTIDRAGQMLSDGASILDMGAYSSRPNAEHISEQEEAERLLPALEQVRKAFPETFISIDTFRSSVAEAALQAGADIINDISGGNLDPELPQTAAKYHAPYIAMHMRGTPQTMQQDLQEKPILAEVLTFFSKRTAELKAVGLHDIIIDPGFGFGKTLAQNYELAQHLDAFGMFGQPVLVGVSRKSVLNKLLGITPVTALNATTALHSQLLQRGADILRVHDVKEAVEAVKVHQALEEAL